MDGFDQIQLTTVEFSLAIREIRGSPYFWYSNHGSLGALKIIFRLLLRFLIKKNFATLCVIASLRQNSTGELPISCLQSESFV